MSVIKRAAVVDEPLDAAAHSALVEGPGLGAVVTFCGVVRNHDQDRQVVRLDYEAHPTAETVLRTLIEQCLADHTAEAVAVSHRFGSLVVGDPAFVVAVSSSHRREAFECAEAIVEVVKTELPMWKNQTFADGTSEWVASA